VAQKVYLLQRKSNAEKGGICGSGQKMSRKLTLPDNLAGS
jgi:hypothetical protein